MRHLVERRIGRRVGYDSAMVFVVERDDDGGVRWGFLYVRR